MRIRDKVEAQKQDRGVVIARRRAERLIVLIPRLIDGVENRLINGAAAPPFDVDHELMGRRHERSLIARARRTALRRSPRLAGRALLHLGLERFENV